MSELLGDIGVVLLFILIGGCFNAAEISMISLRESQVRHLAATQGARGRRLERLVSDPNRFLAAVQIGVTVATMLSSAFGAATVSERVADWLVSRGMDDGLAGTVALVGTTLVISFFSLVLGELTPKRIGMQRREAIALFASGPLSVLARLFRPVVWLLGKSTNAMMRLLRGDPSATGEDITTEELQSLVSAHQSLTSVERRMIADVFEAEDTLVREVMVPRPEVDFLAAALTVSRASRKALKHPHSRFPVIGRDADDVVGVVHIRDLLVPSHALGRAATVADIATPVAVIPGTKRVLDALHEMRSTGQHLAVIVDEYGGTDGIVTLEDLVEEIIGEMTKVGGEVATPARAGEVDGMLNLDDFVEATGLELAPGPYTTAAGFVMARLGRLPVVGDSVLVEDRTLTVTALDGRRVSKIGVSVPAPAEVAEQHNDDQEGQPGAGQPDRAAAASGPPAAVAAGPPGAGSKAGPPAAGSQTSASPAVAKPSRSTAARGPTVGADNAPDHTAANRRAGSAQNGAAEAPPASTQPVPVNGTSTSTTPPAPGAYQPSGRPEPAKGAAQR